MNLELYAKIVTSDEEIIHFGPNPCHSTITYVNSEGFWNESETGVPVRVTCPECQEINK